MIAFVGCSILCSRLNQLNCVCPNTISFGRLPDIKSGTVDKFHRNQKIIVFDMSTMKSDHRMSHCVTIRIISEHYSYFMSITSIRDFVLASAKLQSADVVRTPPQTCYKWHRNDNFVGLIFNHHLHMAFGAAKAWAPQFLIPSRF